MPRSRGERAPESLHHHDAFEFWFWLEPRSLEKVARQYRVSHAAVRKWHLKYSWEERAAEREAKIKAAVESRNDGKAIKVRENLIKIADAVMARFGARLVRDQKTRLELGATAYEPSGSDAVRFAQLQLLLTGQATSRTELSAGRGFVEAFLAMVSTVLRREVPRCCPTCKTDLGLTERIGSALVEASARLEAEQAAVSGKNGALTAPSIPKRLGASPVDQPDDAGPEAV